MICALGVAAAAAAGSAQRAQTLVVLNGRPEAAAHSTCSLSSISSERYLQTARHCLNEPLSLPRRCLFSKHYVQQRCHIYQLLQQPNGHKTSSQHMEGVLDQEQTVTGITCQISRLTIGLGNRTHLLDSCTRLQVRHHSQDVITQTKLSNNSTLAASHCWITQFIHKCNDQGHTDLPQILQKSTERQNLTHT